MLDLDIIVKIRIKIDVYKEALIDGRLRSEETKLQYQAYVEILTILLKEIDLDIQKNIDRIEQEIRKVI